MTSQQEAELALIVADLRASLANISTERATAIEAALEAVNEKFDGRINGLEVTLEYYLERMAGSGQADTGEAVPSASAAAAKALGKGVRQRLPRGYARQFIMIYAESQGRFFSVDEIRTAIDVDIVERFPDSPNLKANRNSLSHILRKLHEGGNLARAVYDERSGHFYFYGLARLLGKTAIGYTYISKAVQPDSRQLQGVVNPDPEFTVKQQGGTP